jgi:cell wall-associated NlpC family hydrolase
MPTLTVLLTTTLTSVLALPLLAVAGLGGSGSACTSNIATATSPASPTATTTAITSPAVNAANTPVTWDAEQLDNAQTIITVGAGRHVPAWGWVVAVATAIQESSLRNLAAGRGDRDSIGLFQQRPSQGWGTPAQLASPAYQARQFYTALLAVPGWQQLPLTQAAQAVQRSAYPDAYAQHTQAAIRLVVQLATQLDLNLPGNLQDAANVGGCPLDEGDGLPDGGTVNLPVGFTLPPDTPAPVVAAITWATQQLGTPYSYGGDCTQPRGGDPAHQCDCSSLMQMAYRAGGITLPRSTVQQAQAGTPVNDLTRLHPGDLIFIPGSEGTAAVPRHVGLYVGDGLILHDPHAGSKTRLSPLERWAPQVAMIRRVVPS